VSSARHFSPPFIARQPIGPAGAPRTRCRLGVAARGGRGGQAKLTAYLLPSSSPVLFRERAGPTTGDLRIRPDPRTMTVLPLGSRVKRSVTAGECRRPVSITHRRLVARRPATTFTTASAWRRPVASALAGCSLPGLAGGRQTVASRIIAPVRHVSYARPWGKVRYSMGRSTAWSCRVAHAMSCT
jgi:hypothetical protein